VGSSQISAEGLDQIQQCADGLPALLLDARNACHRERPRRNLALACLGLFDEDRQPHQQVRTRLAGQRHDGPVPVQLRQI